MTEKDIKSIKIILSVLMVIFICFAVATMITGIKYSFSYKESTVLVAWIISCASIIMTILICISAIIYSLVSKEKAKNELLERNNTLKQIYESIFQNKEM